mgnify:CR=1 FL=1
MLNAETKVIVLFVEGDTEIEFYKALISHLREKNKVPFECTIEYKNMRGIGNYKSNALRQLDDIKRKHPKKQIYAFLCYDTDVFELSKKPPVDMKEVKKRLIENGASKVEFIKAQRTVEDWFLLDYEGVIRYLRLPLKTPKETGNGLAVLQKLFKKANRIYTKGGKAEGFIEHLSIEKIKKQICPSLKKLCACIGLSCKDICDN